MNIPRPFLIGFLGAAVALTPVVPGAFAQQAQVHRMPLRDQPVALTLYSAGIEANLPSSKDAFLLEQLKMLGQRLGEFPQQFGEEEEFPINSIQINDLTTLLMSPMSLKLSVGPTLLGDEPRPIVSFTASPTDERVAERLGWTVRNQVARRQIPATQTSGLTRIEHDELGLIILGKRARNFVAVVNSEFDNAPVIPAVPGLPEGVEPALAFKFEPVHLAKFFNEMVIPDSPDPDLVRDFLEQIGMIGDNTITIEGTLGYTEDRMLGVYRERGSARIAEPFGFPTSLTLGDDILTTIPADATSVLATVFDLEAIYDLLMSYAERFDGQRPPIEDWVRDFTGIDLKEDYFPAVGKRLAIYQAPSTGGGSLASTVAIVEIGDADAMRRVMTKLSEFVEQKITPLARNTVRFAPWKLESGHDAWSLSFPGVPAPIEPCWMIYADKWVVKAATPGALIAAVDHLRDRNAASFATNPHLLAESGSKPSEAIFVQYLDAAFYAQRGYGLASIAATALSNFTRSTINPEARIPTERMPTYNALLADLRPSIAVAKWEGDDLVTTMTADRSSTAQIAAILGNAGSLYTSLIAPAFATGALLPALGQARQNAQQVRAASNMRQLLLALTMHANDNNDRLPASLEVLVERDFVQSQQLVSAYGPSWDGGSDFAYRSDLAGKPFAGIRNSATAVLIVDRAALLAGVARINVGFADGHVEALTQWELARKLQEPGNEGAAEAMGIADWLP